MRTTAAEIQCADYAGLTLVGQKNGRPQYIGSAWQWDLYQNNLDYVQKHGVYLFQKLDHETAKKLNLIK